MNVGDAIGTRTEVYSVPQDMTVHDAALYLREKGVRAVGVTDEAKRLVGIVSQADISDKVAAENKPPAWMRVAEIMSTSLVTVRRDTPLEEALRLMEKHNFYHLLIVDERGGFHGIISVRDLLRIIARDEKARADMLEQMMFPQR
jgi:CBS domain-containing protein